MEYFRFELNFLEKIKKRKTISGTDQEETDKIEIEEGSEGSIQMIDDDLDGNMELEQGKNKNKVKISLNLVSDNDARKNKRDCQMKNLLV